jgi:hypothetical protein
VRCLPTCFPPPLSHRPPHCETDSVDTVPLLYYNLIPVKYYAWFRRKPLIWTTWARNTTQINLGLAFFHFKGAIFGFVSSRLRSHFRPFFVRKEGWCPRASSFLRAISAIFGHFSFRFISYFFFQKSLFSSNHIHLRAFLARLVLL